jgi:hypothetical protein
MSKVLNALSARRKIIVLTFEIFWIVVYLLYVASNTAPEEAAQFLYANY